MHTPLPYDQPVGCRASPLLTPQFFLVLNGPQCVSESAKKEASFWPSLIGSILGFKRWTKTTECVGRGSPFCGKGECIAGDVATACMIISDAASTPSDIDSVPVECAFSLGVPLVAVQQSVVGANSHPQTPELVPAS